MKSQRQQILIKIFFRLSFVSSFFFIQLSAYALSDSPQTFTLDGRLFQSGTTTALLDSSAKLTVQILDPGGTCLLYEEQQTVNTANTEGYFNIQVGSATGAGKRTVNDAGRTMNQIFQNISAISANNVSGQTCTGSSYTPTAGAIRYFRIIVTPSATNVADTLSPDLIIDSVPNAMVAQSIQGVERSSILQVNNSGSTVLTQANLEAAFTTPAYTNLQAILGGGFISTDATGAAIPSFATSPASAAAGDLWYDTATNQLKYHNGTAVQTLGAAGAGISSLTVGSSMSADGTVGGTITASGTIDLSNTGVTAGSYAKVTVDAKGRVTASGTLLEADIPTLSASGKVSGNTITSGSISGSTAISTTGNIQTSNDITSEKVFLYDNAGVGPGYVGFKTVADIAGSGGASYTMTWPNTDGDSGQVLRTDGTGVLTWVSALTNGLNDGLIYVGNVSNVATAVAMSGDATMNNAGVVTLKTVPVAKGGTGATSFAGNAVMVSNLTGSALQALNCTVGQVITFDASGYAICGASSGTGFVNGGNSFAGVATLGTNDNYALNFEVNNTTAMTISQGGNVGIGTTLPTKLLHIEKNTNGNIDVMIKNPNTGTSANTQVSVQSDSAGLTIGAASSTFVLVPAIANRTYVTSSSASGLTFDTATGADFRFTKNLFGTELMRITTDGNVGIGISTPATKLDVQGTSGNTLKIVDGNQGTGKVLTSDANGVASWVAPATGGTVTSVSSANADIAVATGVSTPVLTLNSGVGNNQIVKLDGSAKLPAVDGSALTNITAANISGAMAITQGGTGQITAILGFNALSPITTKGDLITSDGTNDVRLPVGANDYVLTADSTQSSGVKWAAANVGTVTEVTGVSPISVATGTSTPAISITAGTSTGQALRWNGSAWASGFIAMTDLRSTVTGSNSFATTCAANQTLTYNSVGDTMSCANIAIANTQVSGLGTLSTQSVVTLATDVSGVLPVANGGTGTATGSITGTGALVYAAGGANSDITLTPSGTGKTVISSAVVQLAGNSGAITSGVTSCAGLTGSITRDSNGDLFICK